jgi:hypothetical protein
VKSKVKGIFIIFFDIKGSVHKEFILAGQIVNSEYYCGVLCDCMKKCEDFAPNFDNKRTGNDNGITMHHLTFNFLPGNS